MDTDIVHRQRRRLQVRNGLICHEQTPTTRSSSEIGNYTNRVLSWILNDSTRAIIAKAFPNSLRLVPSSKDRLSSTVLDWPRRSVSVPWLNKSLRKKAVPSVSSPSIKRSRGRKRVARRSTTKRSRQCARVKRLERIPSTRIVRSLTLFYITISREQDSDTYSTTSSCTSHNTARRTYMISGVTGYGQPNLHRCWT